MENENSINILMSNEEFRDTIIRFRAKKGYTQKELAGILGMTESHLNNIEKGKTKNPQLATKQKVLEKIAELN